jgi:hypothetical protein
MSVVRASVHQPSLDNYTRFTYVWNRCAFFNCCAYFNRCTHLCISKRTCVTQGEETRDKAYNIRGKKSLADRTGTPAAPLQHQCSINLRIAAVETTSWHVAQSLRGR